MKFVKGKLYRVIKDNTVIPGCEGCILRYDGTNESKNHTGKPVKAGKYCKSIHAIKNYCSVFRWTMQTPDLYELVEHETMVKFCKKLKEKLDGEKEKN